MSSDSEYEIPDKKPRLESLDKYRTIRLDLDVFPPWVREARDEELIKIFEIGVMVKESVESNVAFKQEEIDALLTDKFDPMSTTITTLAKDISEETKTFRQSINKQVEGMNHNVMNGINAMRNSFHSDVQKVVEKVPPLTVINSKIDGVEKSVSSKVVNVEQVLKSNVMESLKRCETKLDAMSTMYNKASTKGSAGEITVMGLLQELRSHTKVDVSTQKGTKGDIHVTSPDGNKYLIEVKNRENAAVPGREITKFESDVQCSPEFKVGIMLSLQSGIAQRARGRRFEVTYVNKQYFIYVPNMLSDPTLAVWSVSLADELAAMSTENLSEAKLNDVTALYNEFKDCMARSKKCEDNLEALKTTVRSLEENLSPVLKIIKDAKTKLNAILHSK